MNRPSVAGTTPSAMPPSGSPVCRGGRGAATRISEFGTFEAIIGCIAAGMGVALMPKEIINQRELAKSIRVHALPSEIERLTAAGVTPAAFAADVKLPCSAAK